MTEDDRGEIIMNQECQAVNCTNIGVKMRVLITIEGKDEKRFIYMCQHHIYMQNKLTGKGDVN